MNLPQAHFLFLFNFNSNFPKKLGVGFSKELKRFYHSIESQFQSDVSSSSNTFQLA